MNGGHNGVDLVAPWGTPLYALTDQRVIDIKESPLGYGKHVRCVDDKYEYTYAHLSTISCYLHQYLNRGDVLGKMGNTGFVISGATPYWKHNPYAGTHEHITMRERDTGGKWRLDYGNGNIIYVKNYDNGVFGAIDPAPFFGETDEEIKMRLLLTVRSLGNTAVELLRKIISLKQNEHI
mgnify:FL=1